MTGDTTGDNRRLAAVLLAEEMRDSRLPATFALAQLQSQQSVPEQLQQPLSKLVSELNGDLHEQYHHLNNVCQGDFKVDAYPEWLELQRQKIRGSAQDDTGGGVGLAPLTATSAVSDADSGLSASVRLAAPVSQTASSAASDVGPGSFEEVRPAASPKKRGRPPKKIAAKAVQLEVAKRAKVAQPAKVTKSPQLDARTIVEQKISPKLILYWIHRNHIFQGYPMLGLFGDVDLDELNWRTCQSAMWLANVPPEFKCIVKPFNKMALAWHEGDVNTPRSNGINVHKHFTLNPGDRRVIADMRTSKNGEGFGRYEYKGEWQPEWSMGCSFHVR
jgi:hypothetical protein